MCNTWKRQLEPLSTVCIYEAIKQLCRVHGCLQNMFRLSLADFLNSTDSAVNSSSIDQCFSSLLAYAHSHCVVHSPGSVFYMQYSVLGTVLMATYIHTDTYTPPGLQYYTMYCNVTKSIQYSYYMYIASKSCSIPLPFGMLVLSSEDSWLGQ